MWNKHYFVYIATNKSNTLYVGITNNLMRRMGEHKNKVIPGFTQKYNINKLVYYETFSEPTNAISREKQLKKWSRKKKVNLIKSLNPEFKDLMEEFE